LLLALRPQPGALSVSSSRRKDIKASPLFGEENDGKHERSARDGEEKDSWVNLLTAVSFLC
jgi:hypothetical protein